MPLWLRWSWRDLKQRWVLVAAIALVIAAGTGTFAGLGSTSEWRRQSNDASFAATRFHDLRVELAPGSFAPEGALAGAAARIEHPEWIAATAERLVLPVQVDASTPAETILVPGEAIGVRPVANPPVDRLAITAGRDLAPEDAGRPVAVLEQKFADHYGLPPTGSVRLTGGVRVDYVGTGFFPEHLMVIGRQGAFLAEGNFAVVQLPLTSLQHGAGLVGQVNDLVLTVSADVDPGRVRSELEATLARHLPDISAEVLERDDNPAYRVLYDDIDTDQQFWNVFAFLILASASFAAFNLTSRVVQAQRREIGIGMALGVPRWSLAIRPLAMGAQVALLGVLAGVAVGYVIDLGLRALFESFLPLPVWKTPFQVGRFAEAAALGFVLPLVATAIPVWRAVSVQPVEAIRTGHLTGSTGGLAPIAEYLPAPRRSYERMPLRNVLRTPRRTLLTALGIGAAITALIGVLGMLDSFLATIDRGEDELLRSAPGRLDVELDRPYAIDSPTVDAIQTAPGVEAMETGLRIPAGITSFARGGEPIDVVVDVLDFSTARWTPTLVSATPEPSRGLVLSEAAAADLGVQPGDAVVVRHPRRTGPDSFTTENTRVPVAALHPNPMRFVAYLDTAAADLFGLEGMTNVVTVHPEPQVSEESVREALFGVEGVASAQPVDATTRLFRDLMEEFVGFLQLVAFVVLGMALLIAFNSTSIAVDERRREHATMFAFGLPVRTVLRLTTAESMLTGMFGTALGIGLGYLLVRWLVLSLTPQTMPDLGVVLAVSPTTIAIAVLLGVVAVAVAPLFTVRRMRKLEIADALRIVE